MIAFSPRVRHAINFALKYHEGQRRKNRNAPYVMHPFQVTLILARYGRPEEELLGGLLHDVVEDCVSTNAEADEMLRKIADKFGTQVAAIVSGVTEKKRDDKDRPLPVDQRRTLYLRGLETAPQGSLWVCAADKVQNGMELTCDLLDAADRDAVWASFSEGKVQTVAWYRRVHSKLKDLDFDGDIMDELQHTATMLESAAETDDAPSPHVAPA